MVIKFWVVTSPGEIKNTLYVIPWVKLRRIDQLTLTAIQVRAGIPTLMAVIEVTSIYHCATICSNKFR
jgi:hypothetical protein